MSVRSLRRHSTDAPNGEVGKIKRSYRQVPRRQATPVFYRADLLARRAANLGSSAPVVEPRFRLTEIAQRESESDNGKTAARTSR
jgi:hypothetical protein